MDKLRNTDLYELIGTTETATTQEIKKAYRKKALSCHPDKNPDNPRAAELFHELSEALEILTDTSARAAYDKVVVARRQAKLRTKELDSKRKKLKEDLEAREDAYLKSLNSKYNDKSDEDKLRDEIERLRKEGSKQVEEEIALVKRKIWDDLKKSHGESNVDVTSYRIKIKWNNGGYDYNSLYRILSKYGDIVALVVSSTRKGRAMVEFRNKTDAETALSTEIGFTENPLKFVKLWNTNKESARPVKEETDSKNTIGHDHLLSSCNDSRRNEPDVSHVVDQKGMSDAEFERTVLSNLKKAEERKRFLEKSNVEEGT